MKEKQVGGPQNNTIWKIKGEGRKGSNITQIDKQHDSKKVATLEMSRLLSQADMQSCKTVMNLRGLKVAPNIRM